MQIVPSCTASTKLDWHCSASSNDAVATSTAPCRFSICVTKASRCLLLSPNAVSNAAIKHCCHKALRCIAAIKHCGAFSNDAKDGCCSTDAGCLGRSTFVPVNQQGHIVNGAHSAVKGWVYAGPPAARGGLVAGQFVYVGTAASSGAGENGVLVKWPAARAGHAAWISDRDGGQMLIFGGVGIMRNLGRGRWKRESTSTSRGEASCSYLTDGWAWDGVSWSPLTETAVPPPPSVPYGCVSI